MNFDNHILENIGKISHLSADIIQGRYDLICPPESAYNLAKSWERAKLRLINFAGHAISEPEISNALILATDKLIQRIKYF